MDIHFSCQGPRNDIVLLFPTKPTTQEGTDHTGFINHYFSYEDIRT